MGDKELREITIAAIETAQAVVNDSGEIDRDTANKFLLKLKEELDEFEVADVVSAATVNEDDTDEPPISESEPLIEAGRRVRSARLDQTRDMIRQARGLIDGLQDFVRWADYTDEGLAGSEVERGLYLSEPHGAMIADGRKTAIAKARRLDLEGEWILVSGQQAYGVVEIGPPERVGAKDFDERFDEHRVSTREREKWWATYEHLWLYPVASIKAYKSPKPVVLPQGVQTIIRQVEYKSADRETRLLQKLADLPDKFTWIPDFASVTGSQIYAKDGREPNDVDVILRARDMDGSFYVIDESAKAEVPVDASFALKLERLLSDKLGAERVQYVNNPYGPNWKSLPLYDLCLVRKPELKYAGVDEPEFAAQQYKDRSGWLNAPMLAHLTVYGRESEPIPGRSGEITHKCGDLQVDEHLECKWIETLNGIEGIEGRASCEGHDHDGRREPTFFIFRLKDKTDDELAEKVAKALDKEKTKALAHTGAEDRPRICVAADLIYGEDGWEKWWEGLAGKVRTALVGLGDSKMANKARQASVDKYPDESKKLHFVMQNHYLGKSCHLDARFEYKRGGDNWLHGFTVTHQVAGAIKEPVTTMKAAQAADARPGGWKMDLETGAIKQGNLMAFPKAPKIPKEWLAVEGVTDEPDPGEKPPAGATQKYPGVFTILSKGRVEWGVQKSDAMEFFLSGSKWKGRWLFRRIERKEAPSSGEGEKAPDSYLILMQPEDQTPNVLAAETVKDGWLPPRGISCLPRRVRDSMSEKYHFWKMDTREALAARKQFLEDQKKPGRSTPKAGTAGLKTFEGNDGRDWLLLWTANAFKDSDKEIFSTAAIEDYASRHETEGKMGEYQFWHLPGTKFGDILWQGTSGRFLVEMGPFDNSEMGQTFRKFFEAHPDGHPKLAPQGWGASHKYIYDPEDKKDGIYQWFEKEESSVLPAHEAANPYNPGMEVFSVNEKQKTALAIIGNEVGIGGDELVKMVERIGETQTKKLEADGIDYKAKKDFAKRLRDIAGKMKDGPIKNTLLKLCDEMEKAYPAPGAKANEGTKDLKSIAAKLAALAKKVGGDVEKQLVAIAKELEGYAKPGDAYPKPAESDAREADLTELDSGAVIGLAPESTKAADDMRAPLGVYVKIVEPGWGNKRDNNYYSAEMLRRDARVFEGSKMFATDHVGGEKNVRNEVSIMEKAPVFFTSGGAPVGLARIFDPDFAEATRNRIKSGHLESLRCSIYAKGKVREGFEQDGRKGNLVESISPDPKPDVDWVSRSGAGGHATEVLNNEVVESALAGTNLPAFAQGWLAEREYANEDELSKAIKKTMAGIKSLTGSGQVFGQGQSDAPADERMSDEDYNTEYRRIAERHGLTPVMKEA